MKSDFQRLKETPSDINEHLDTLCALASECTHITEMGVRYVVSTFAFAEGMREGTLVSIDMVHPHSFTAQYTGGLEKVTKLCADKGINFSFTLGDTRTINIEPTDLLFIDTDHVYAQLSAELTRHGDKARKYIVCHDTTACPELVQAINEFMEANPRWQIHKVYENNNGLTVLKRA